MKNTDILNTKTAIRVAEDGMAAHEIGEER